MKSPWMATPRYKVLAKITARWKFGRGRTTALAWLRCCPLLLGIERINIIFSDNWTGWKKPARGLLPMRLRKWSGTVEEGSEDLPESNRGEHSSFFLFVPQATKFPRRWRNVIWGLRSSYLGCGDGWHVTRHKLFCRCTHRSQIVGRELQVGDLKL